METAFLSFPMIFTSRPASIFTKRITKYIEDIPARVTRAVTVDFNNDSNPGNRFGVQNLRTRRVRAPRRCQRNPESSYLRVLRPLDVRHILRWLSACPDRKSPGRTRRGTVRSSLL